MHSFIYDLLQALLIKTHIPSIYKPVHLTLSISVSHLTLITGSRKAFISGKSLTISLTGLGPCRFLMVDSVILVIVSMCLNWKV